MSKEKPTNRIIVITGATRGLGLALKEELSKDNIVISMSRSEVPDNERTFKVDVGNRAEVQAAMDAVAQKYGKIDLLINNAGFGMSGATELIPEHDVTNIVNTNYLGVVWCCQCALPHMQAGSKIVNVGSMSALVPMPYRSMYNSTKAAVVSFSYSLRMELKPVGIGVTVLILSAIATNFSINRNKVVLTNERYGEKIATADAFIDDRKMSERVSLKRATTKIVNICNTRKLNLRYFIGVASSITRVMVTLFPKFTHHIISFAFTSPTVNRMLKPLQL